MYNIYNIYNISHINAFRKIYLLNNDKYKLCSIARVFNGIEAAVIWNKDN
jgi:hypothetical protein